jgi:hypothetical protein
MGENKSSLVCVLGEVNVCGMDDRGHTCTAEEKEEEKSKTLIHFVEIPISSGSMEHSTGIIKSMNQKLLFNNMFEENHHK